MNISVISFSYRAYSRANVKMLALRMDSNAQIATTTP
jgi:hypothetical protein